MSIAYTSGALTGIRSIVDEIPSAITNDKLRDTHVRDKAVLETDMLGQEELDRLVHRVFLSKNGDSPHSVVFCGVDDPNGSAIVCARAAQTLAAKTYRRICIIETDTRKSDTYRLLGAERPSSYPAVDNLVREQCAQVRSNLWIARSLTV
jgi:hypothetical protein